MNNNVKIFLFFFMIGIAIYYHSLNGGYIFDDNKVVLNEPALKLSSFTEFIRLFLTKERPVRLFSFYLDNKIWGLNPFGYRLTNLLIHILNAFLLYVFFKKISKDKNVSFFSAAIFLVHPVLPAAVCYITGRKDLLGLLFSLISLICYINFRESSKKIFFVVASISFLLAYFCKEMFITVPIIIVFYEIMVMKKHILPKCQIFISACIIVLLTYMSFFREIIIGNIYERLMIPQFFVSYLRLFFDPTFAKVDYVGYFQEIYHWRDVHWAVIAFYILIGSAYFYVIRLYYKKNALKGFMLLAFLIALLPVLQIIPHSEKFAEHYLYFPSVFLSFFIAASFFDFFKDNNFIIVGTIALLVTLSFFSFQRTKIFMNEDVYWKTAYEKNSKSFRAMHSIGRKYMREGKLDEALPLLTDGLYVVENQYISSDIAYAYYYDYLNDLAIIYMAKKDFAKAETLLNIGLRTLIESDKREAFVYNLAILYLYKYDKDGVKLIEQLIEENPNYNSIKYFLYDYYWEKGELRSMERFIDTTIEKSPKSFFGISKKCLHEFKRGDKTKAIFWYEKIKEISPKNFYELNDIGEIEIYMNNYSKAEHYFLMALEEKPAYGRTFKNLRKIIEKER